MCNLLTMMLKRMKCKITEKLTLFKLVVWVHEVWWVWGNFIIFIYGIIINIGDLLKQGNVYSSMTTTNVLKFIKCYKFNYIFLRSYMSIDN